jgi:outer membrane protein assembly factor BamB
MKDNRDKIKLFSNLITISGIFCVAIALLLLINYIHLQQTKPLDTTAMKALVLQFQADPDNDGLKTEIRNLDLLARKAYFTSEWQIRTGALMLLLGGIAFAAFLRTYHTLKARIGEPLIETNDRDLVRFLSRRWILVTGGVLMAAALATSFLTTDYLKFYEETGSVMQPPPKAEVKVSVVDDAGTPAAGVDTSQEPEPQNTGAIVKVEEQTSPSAEEPDTLTPAVPAVTAKPPEKSVREEKDHAPTSGWAPPAGMSAAFAKNHPSFRGPWGEGVSFRTGIPVDWDGPSGRNIKWKAELNKKGYNSPVIWDDKLFLAGADDQAEVVYCFNRISGNLLWEKNEKDIPGSPAAEPKVSSDTGLSAPSVATDGTTVYAIFASGDIVALDFNGNRIWGKNLGVPDNHYGHSSSLITWNNRVIVQFDTNKSGRLLALDGKTGDIVWDTPRKTKISWSSPMLAEIDGKLQIVTTASPTVSGYDFNTGAQIWAIDCLSGEVGPSAAIDGGLVYAANEYATLAAIRPGPTPKIVWQADEYLPEAASPAAHDGLLFIATSYGVFVCYDSKTGDKLWEKEFSTGFYGSPMIVDGKVYAMERNGVMHIFKADRTMQSLGDPVLGEKSVVTPAFADGAIYLRGDKFLYCVGK